MTKATLGVMLGVLLGGCGSSGESTGGAPATDLTVVLSASTQSYQHSDDLSGQTARSVRAGVRSLTLIDESSGASWQLFDHGPGGQEVSWDDGAATAIATIPPSDVVAGHYTRARMVQDWSRYTIDATLHDGTDAVAGSLSGLQVTSDGAVVDGSARPQGYYEQTFTAPGVDKTFSGDDAPLPSESKTAEAEAVIENGQWAVYFPVDVTVADGKTGVLTVRANMNDAYRWDDLPGPGFEDAVYDFAPPLYEPVAQFGGNRFDVTLSP
ncbi:MAG: hypothetical protein KC776_06295 [Myxococcales bacterium]|nr:hypothetical protein [Myxococcales bacterium]MCB9578731.1 hypothetical protein [Polyangiaceae bacterium]